MVTFAQISTQFGQKGHKLGQKRYIGLKYTHFLAEKGHTLLSDSLEIDFDTSQAKDCLGLNLLRA